MNTKQNYLNMRLPNYDKYPCIEVPGVEGAALSGWPAIVALLKDRIRQHDGQRCVVAMDYYPGVHEEELLQQLVQPLQAATLFSTGELFKGEADIRQLTQKYVTDDAVFGYLTCLELTNFFDPAKLAAARARLEDREGVILVYGYGATLVATTPDILVYADMPRWELQLRYRRKEIANLGVQNKGEKASLQYKRGFFVDWRVADRHKKEWMQKWDYVLDTTKPAAPVLLDGAAYRRTLKAAARRPFRVMPFFDPGPWGGQWMKEVCDLDRNEANFAWCFDCVPEENSLLLKVGGVLFETPAINLVFYQAKQYYWASRCRRALAMSSPSASTSWIPCKAAT